MPDDDLEGRLLVSGAFRFARVTLSRADLLRTTFVSAEVVREFLGEEVEVARDHGGAPH